MADLMHTAAAQRVRYVFSPGADVASCLAGYLAFTFGEPCGVRLTARSRTMRMGVSHALNRFPQTGWRVEPAELGRRKNDLANLRKRF